LGTTHRKEPPSEINFVPAHNAKGTAMTIERAMQQKNTPSEDRHRLTRKADQILRGEEPEVRLDLVGRCFHTFDDKGAIRHQGIVRGQVGPTVYLIQYFEWFVGEPSTLAIFDLADMKGWQFYENAEHMNFWYQHRYHPPAAEDEAA
jgi:hypothetical protein